MGILETPQGPELLIPKKNVVFDATILSSLMSCARFFDIRFNYRMVSASGKSNSLETGALAHKVFEVYYKHQIDGFPREIAEGNAIAAGMLYVNGCPHCANVVDVEPGTELPCKHEPGEYPRVQNTPELNEPHREGQGARVGWRYVLQTCQDYFNHYRAEYKCDTFIPLGAEVVKSKVLYEDDEIRVACKAKFDLLVDTNQIGIISMDHKTMKQKRQKSRLSNQFIIHCLLLNSRNVLVNKVGFQTSLKIEDRLSREMVSYTSDHLLEWQSEILPYYAYKYVQFMESGYWPPDYTHCDTIYGSCAYKPVCESDRNMRADVLRADFVKAPIWDPRNREDE